MTAKSEARLASIVEACTSWRPKRWLTTCEKPSNGIGAVLHALHVHSRRTAKSYVHAEEAAHDFEIPKIVQATFYAMLLNDDIGLGILSGFLVANLKASLEGLRWMSFESWMHARPSLEAQLHQRSSSGGTQRPVNGREESSGSNDPLPPSSDEEEKTGVIGGKERETRKMILFPNFTSTEMAAEYVQDTFCWPLRECSALRPNPLPEVYHGLYSGFDLGMLTRFADESNIPEMAFFYAMVLNNVAKLGLTSIA
ncbi:LOW QUALITY PROTEIN: hypothetical protein Cgig2_005771 [Carnegiea gigantea]|uniref:Uncharacterized protein n=1 Tax=Carnegiea gigantea TaxID=171969 RepID=A0A9Q1JZX4_9CARY|nr:LOW QUALITY PROTEIN: hypothetical protein Cgig2_005771 [Carnegiea gigantea]